MSELLRDVTEIEQELFALGQLLDECGHRMPATTVYNGAKVLGRIREILESDSKYPLNVTKRGYGGLVAALSPTLDRLLDSRFDMAAEAEADLGTIEHKGEKVTVKIKVVRGE